MPYGRATATCSYLNINCQILLYMSRVERWDVAARLTFAGPFTAADVDSTVPVVPPWPCCTGAGAIQVHKSADAEVQSYIIMQNVAGVAV